MGLFSSVASVVLAASLQVAPASIAATPRFNTSTPDSATTTSQTAQDIAYCPTFMQILGLC